MYLATDVSTDRTAGVIPRLVEKQRRALFDAFLAFREGDVNGAVLDVSLPAPAPADESEKSVMSHCSLVLHQDTVHLPCDDRSVDWVLCDQVLEQLPSRSHQRSCVEECFRVARKGVFITAANRKHPLEFHSGLPFAHWLPPEKLAKLQARSARARRIPGMLLDSAQLYAVAAGLPNVGHYDVGHKRIAGIKAHFFLMIRKTA